MTRDKGGFKESLASNLSFAFAGAGVDTPSDFARVDVFIASDFGGGPHTVDQINANDLLEVAVVFSDPLSSELRLEGRSGFHDGRK